MSIRLTPSSSCIYILLLTPPTFSFKPLMHTSCLCILYIVYMVQVQTQDRQTQDRSNPRQVKHKTRKPKTGQTQDRSNPRQGQTQDRGQTQDNIYFVYMGTRGARGGGLNFVFRALRPAVSEIRLSDFILKPQTILQKFPILLIIIYLSYMFIFMYIISYRNQRKIVLR